LSPELDNSIVTPIASDDCSIISNLRGADPYASSQKPLRESTRVLFYPEGVQ
jgi:phosphopentomutase